MEAGRALGVSYRVDQGDIGFTAVTSLLLSGSRDSPTPAVFRKGLHFALGSILMARGHMGLHRAPLVSSPFTPLWGRQWSEEQT